MLFAEKNDIDIDFFFSFQKCIFTTENFAVNSIIWSLKFREQPIYGIP